MRSFVIKVEHQTIDLFYSLQNDLPKTRPRATTEVGRTRPQRHSHDQTAASRAKFSAHNEDRATEIVIPSKGIGELVARTTRKMSGAGIVPEEITAAEIAEDIKKNEEEADRNGNDGKKRLPTVFKYQGQAKEVYVCGKR